MGGGVGGGEWGGWCSFNSLDIHFDIDNELKVGFYFIQNWYYHGRCYILVYTHNVSDNLNGFKGLNKPIRQIPYFIVKICYTV